MALNETTLRTLKAQDKPFKVSDERSLYLLESPSGARCWRLKYRIVGSEKVLALGTYPDVPLKAAREQRDEARRLLAAGVDPGVKRKAEKVTKVDTFCRNRKGMARSSAKEVFRGDPDQSPRKNTSDAVVR